MPRQLRPRHPTTGRAFRPELGRFGVLPPELRDQIYCYLYGGWSIDICRVATDGDHPHRTTHSIRRPMPTRITSTFVNDHGDSARPRPEAIVDSLLVSRRFSEEVVYILYTANCFCFIGPGFLEMFQNRIGGGCRDNITKVKLDCGRLSPLGTSRVWWQNTMQALVRLPAIKYLTISLIVRPPPQKNGGTCGRFAQVRESKRFRKLQLAQLQCWYYGEEHREGMEVYLEGMQKFLMGDLEPSTA